MENENANWHKYHCQRISTKELQKQNKTNKKTNKKKHTSVLLPQHYHEFFPVYLSKILSDIFIGLTTILKLADTTGIDVHSCLIS